MQHLVKQMKEKEYKNLSALQVKKNKVLESSG